MQAFKMRNEEKYS